MTKKIIIIAILVFVVLLSGCGVSKVKQDVPTVLQKVENNPSVIKTMKRKIKAIYTGEEITKKVSKKIAFMAVIENLKPARPQSGLSSADVIFETMAEGGIPRFLVIFQSKDVDKIGPIRSDRYYFNELSNTYDLPIAHCGGNENALAQIAAGQVMSLNEMKNGSSYWRDNSRKAPHNLYTSSNELRNLILKCNYVKEPKFNIQFDNSYWNNFQKKATNITLNMSNYYTTTYTYENGRYYKSMGDSKYMEKAIDKNNKKQVSTKNVIIQLTTIKDRIGDPEQGVDITLTGAGDGYIFSSGKYTKIKWSKESTTSATILKDMNDREVKLSVGNTIWDIGDISSKITIK